MSRVFILRGVENFNFDYEDPDAFLLEDEDDDEDLFSEEEQDGAEAELDGEWQGRLQDDDKLFE